MIKIFQNTLILKLITNKLFLEELFSNYTMTKLPKQHKILEHYVLEKKDLDTREVHCTELFQDLWLKVEISPSIMELEENQFMEKNLMIKSKA
jgi:hypothetical protein